jgi:hypothetical protein
MSQNNPNNQKPLSLLRHVRKNYLYGLLSKEGKIYIQYLDHKDDAFPVWWTKKHFNQAVEDLLLEGSATIDCTTLTLSLASTVPSPQEDYYCEEQYQDSTW